mgnify:FL=1
MTLCDSQIREAVKLYEEHGTFKAASEASGIPLNTLYSRYARADQLEENKAVDHPAYELTPLPDNDIPVDQIVDQLHSRFKKRKANKEAKKWIPVKMKSDEPIGLLWMGDPHIDDNYCDWDSLRSHLALIQSTDGLFGCNLGDYQNNWIGRLGRLYGEQDTSHKTAWRLVEWLIQEMNPLILIGGNHDMWSGASDPLKWLASPHAILEDWEARVELQFPNGRNCRIHAAHDMPGHSQWNALHAQNKMARFKSNASLYISGHKHNWALGQIELVEEETTTWLARARGYKYHDTYAFTKGFEQQKFGQAILQIIDPHNPSPVSWVQCFADPHEGAEYLQYRRSLRK